MVVFSSLRTLLKGSAPLLKNGVVQRPMSEHKLFPMVPSRWQWIKFKDYMHFYLMLGFIPCTLGVLYANVFVGPATLAEVPENYEPKYWEYYRNPVTRFLAKYVLSSPQQDYEKYLNHIFMEDEKKKMRALEHKIKDLIAERNDYQAYYYRPILAKYHRVTKESADYVETVHGD